MQTLNSQDIRVFFLLTSNKFFMKSKNVAAKKLCGGVVALKIPRKLTCGSFFCNVVACKLLHFLSISGGSVSLRYQLVRCYNVSKTSVSFRYQLWRLCDVLSWSVSLRYHLVRRYDVSNWSILFTYQWDVANTFQISPPHWRTSCNVVMKSQHGPRHPDLYET